MTRHLRLFGLSMCFLLLSSPGLEAQEMSKAEYYRYVPLNYTRPIRQAQASDALHLFGDRNAPGYSDVAPTDGIDDTRGEILHALALRFAPYLVLNTTNLPMDWKKFWDQGGSWPLYVDTWNTAREGGELLREEQIDFLALDGRPCRTPSRGSPRQDTDDCRLLSLIEEFDPEDPQSDRFQKAAVDPLLDEFKVIYWNFPGFDEKSWKAEYQDPVTKMLPRKYESFAKTYMHPFIAEVGTNREGVQGYELVLQYWFFYPTNDGANNHEGDWEHVNIVISPRHAVTRPQTAEEVQGMLDGRSLSAAGEAMLVIKRVDYYFHERVWTVDYARPNVYSPREEWQRERDAMTPERVNADRIWAALRERAYEDVEETIVNTHIIGFIGADSKGNDMLLAGPGGKNRDSHGTYPLQGLYKDVGPAGTSEAIQQKFDYRAYLESDRPGLEDGPFGRNSVVRFDRPDRVEVWPDWERIHDLLYTDPEVRREWSWMVIPIRWGYPATRSLFAGIVSHASTGNLAPQGPSQNKGWNLTGAGSGFHDYNPHQFGGYFALGWQDTFNNSWGFLNATLPTLTILPPFDVLFRVVGAPVALLTDQPPTFFDQDQIPFRFAGLSYGWIGQEMDDAFLDLFLNEKQIEQILGAVGVVEPGEGEIVPTETIHDPLKGFATGISFFVGRRFVSENALVFLTGDLGYDLLNIAEANVYQLRSDLEFLEYAGSLRWNFLTGSLQPFAKVGYGWAWYRLNNVGVDGVDIPTPKSDRISKFVWHWGVGVEWLPIVSYRPPPRGIDVGIRADFSTFRHGLGLEQISDPVTLALGERRASASVVRPSFLIALTIGF